MKSCRDSTGNYYTVATAVEEAGVFVSAVTFGMEFGTGIELVLCELY